ncbi:MAG TPA: hypothetical protein VLE70_09440 [Anaerolineae bacterium]|jgi:hypothetical protein|nr:hypothetical protein [Anaerolineae bacterium]
MDLLIIFLVLLLLMALFSAVIVISAVKLSGRARRFEEDLGDGVRDEGAGMKDEEVASG